MYWIGICMFAMVALVFLCLLVCNCSSVKLAIDVIDASADFLAETKRILIIPMTFFIFSMLSVILWVTCVAGIYSKGKITANKGLGAIP